MNPSDAQALTGYIERLEDENAALRAEVARLRAALGPFRTLAQYIPAYWADEVQLANIRFEGVADWCLRVGDVRRAAREEAGASDD